MLLCSPAGNDLLYDDSLPEQGRNFANKIWNAFRLVKSWKVDEDISQPESSAIAVKWIDEVVRKAVVGIESNFTKFRISEALMINYKLFWDEFSGWYLEIIKPEYRKPIDRITYDSTLSVFDKLLKLTHPFMPFITEEIWQLLIERKDGESLMISRLPEVKKFNNEMISGFELIKEIISSLRTVRKENGIASKEKLTLLIRSEMDSFDNRFLPVIRKLCNLEEIKFVEDKQENAATFMVGTTEFYIPLDREFEY